MIEKILQVQGLQKSYGGLAATDNVDLDIHDREVLAIIGPNGAGKTTLVEQLSGNVLPDAGQILLAGDNITSLAPHARAHLGISRTFQVTSVFLELTILENVALAVQAHTGHSFQFMKPVGRDSVLIERAMAVLETVGMAGKARLQAGAVSHGEHRQLEIAMALASKPRLLLLDEPMAGMGPDESLRMTELLRSLKGEMTIVLVEHDMDTVFALADRIAVLVYGQLIAVGSPEDIRSNPDVRKAYLGEGEAT